MTHDERVYHHLYVESKSPLENAECIASLEELMEELQSENAKLRELVRDMWDGMCGYAHDCRNCEHYELFEGQRFDVDHETCRAVVGDGVNKVPKYWTGCSECGCVWDFFYQTGGFMGPPTYCPKCGRRVEVDG